MSFSRHDRAETERAEQRTLTLDDSAVASHPADLRVSLWRWSRRYPRWPLILIASLLLSVGLTLTVDLMFLVSLPLALIPNFFYWNRVREHFRHGDANPGIVVAKSPLRIAVWTDLSKGDGAYPALHIASEEVERSWDRSLDVGARVATVALYEDGDDARAPYWARFTPRPVEPVAADPQAARALLDGFAPERWARLEAALAALGEPREGLHRLVEPQAAWSDAVLTPHAGRPSAGPAGVERGAGPGASEPARAVPRSDRS